jgi:hypothetical protein
MIVGARATVKCDISQEAYWERLGDEHTEWVFLAEYGVVRSAVRQRLTKSELVYTEKILK